MITEITKKIFIDEKHLPGRISNTKNLTNFKVYEVMDIEGRGEWAWLINDIGDWITTSNKHFYPIDFIRNNQLDNLLK